MTTARSARQAREALDRRRDSLGPVSRYAIPQRGWVRAIRDALGMSAADLAERMGVTGASVRALEKSEVSGGARLSSLRRAAAAMDCTFVYAFIPNQGLENTVREQASRILAVRDGRVRQTMLLEDQAGEALPSAREEQLQAIVDSRGLWSAKRTEDVTDPHA